MSNSKKPAILVTGVTGSIGNELAKQLADNNIPFRAMVRSLEDTEKLSRLKGIEIVKGDFADPNSLQSALEGIERAFLLTNSSEHAESLQNNFVEAAVQSGLKHIVKLSQYAASEQSPVRFLRYHAAVEKNIQNAGITFTFLRPNLFMQGLLGFRDLIVKQNKFFASVGDAKISLIDIRDIAAVAVEALSKAGHENKTYDLTGPEALSHAQLAEKISDETGRKVTFIDVTPDDMRSALLAVGFPAWQADGLIEDYAHYSRGEASTISKNVLQITGKQPHSFTSFLHDYSDFFKAI